MTTLVWLLGLAVSILTAALFIPRELWKRWRLRIVDRLDLALRRKVSRFDRHYRDFMLSSLRFIDTKGLATVGPVTPELDAVFVDVSLAYSSPHKIPESLLAHLSADVTDRHSINDFLDVPDPMVLAVVGAAGSGKTTLLRHTARQLCQNRRRVPILLSLRDHVRSIVETPEVALPTLVARPAVPEPPDWFEQRLRNGDCVVLLDGLDEIANSDDRRSVATWVETHTRRYPRNRFVITSRPQGYRDAPIEGAVVLQVRGFTDEQIARFVHAWYLAAEKHSTGTSGEDVRLRADTAAAELLDLLNAAPNLYDLTINPLLLTMIANVHRYRGALPGSRADLYGEICQVMLWRRQEAKKLRVELSGDKKESLLRTVAFTMMQHRVRDLSRAEILTLLDPALRRMSTQMSAADFLTDVSSNGLLIERENGLYSFAHLTFQEYLAATHIRDKGLVEVLAGAVDDTWWRETSLLYAARSDADPIVAACLASGTVTALALAFDIADHGGDLAEDLRCHLDNIPDSAEFDPAWGRLRAGVLVTRYLRPAMVQTELAGRVCGRPVSTDIYRRFLADTGAAAADAPGSGPNQPVTGVRASDALAFVRWVNEVTEGGPGYRLPTRTEIQDPAVQRALAATPTLSVWLHPAVESMPSDLWTPAGSDHPLTIDAETLAHHIDADIAHSIPALAFLLLLHALIRDRDRGDAFTRTLDAARSRPNVRVAAAIDDAGTLDLAFAHARDVIRARARAHHRVGNTLAFSRARTRALDIARGLDKYQVFGFRTDVMGNALSFALREALGRDSKDAQSWLAEFRRTLISKARVAGVTRIRSLESLVEHIRTAGQGLRVALGRTMPTWTQEIARRLEERALPILTRREAITANTATAVRIAALCLAAEAEAHASPVGEFYRGLAAGITLMERRASGEAPATETIMLAMAGGSLPVAGPTGREPWRGHAISTGR